MEIGKDFEKESPDPLELVMQPIHTAAEIKDLETEQTFEVPGGYSYDQGAAELERINGIIAANQDLLSSLLELLRTQVRVCLKP
jgi:hypothetical protein